MEFNHSFWDTMAERYPHYDDPAMQKDVQRVLAWAKSQGLDFSDRSLLDIGCGTGTVSIPLALEKARVTAIDLSRGMLDALKSDAEALKLRDYLTSYQSDWESFPLTQTFDIVLASMTPAISQEIHIDKMLSATHAMGLYVGWGRYKTNAFLEALMQAHDAPEKMSGGCIKVADFMHYLDTKELTYSYEFFTTAWEETYTYDEAKTYAAEQLARKNLSPDERKVDAIIRDFMHEETVTIETQAEKGMVLFSKYPSTCPKHT